MSNRLLKEITRVNMRNILVMVILAVWCISFLNGTLNYKTLTDAQEAALSKLDTVMLMIIGYYLNQKSLKTTDEHE